MNLINSRLNLISFESYPMCSETTRACCQRKLTYHSVFQPIKTLLTAKKEKMNQKSFFSRQPSDANVGQCLMQHRKWLDEYRRGLVDSGLRQSVSRIQCDTCNRPKYTLYMYIQYTYTYIPYVKVTQIRKDDFVMLKNVSSSSQSTTPPAPTVTQLLGMLKETKQWQPSVAGTIRPI